MAASQVETVSTGADKAKLACCGFGRCFRCGFYLLGKQGAYGAMGNALLVGLVAAAAYF
jgi:preprotein translocase subunit SecE